MASRSNNYLRLILVSLILTISARASCFLPNGTDRNTLYNTTDGSDAYLRCHTTPDGEASMCCRLGDGSPDTCRPDGLCQNGRLIWRESCSDSTWRAHGCVRLCIDGSMGDGDVQLTQCDDQSLCCDQNGSGEQCCNRGQGRWIDGDGEVVGTRPVSLESSTTGAAGTMSRSTGTTAAPTLSSTSAAASSSSSNTGAIVGGVVGGIGGALVIAAALFFLLRSRRSPRNPRPEDVDNYPMSQPIVEAPTVENSTAHELAAERKSASK